MNDVFSSVILSFPFRCTSTIIIGRVGSREERGGRREEGRRQEGEEGREDGGGMRKDEEGLVLLALLKL